MELEETIKEYFAVRTVLYGKENADKTKIIVGEGDTMELFLPCKDGIYGPILLTHALLTSCLEDLQRKVNHERIS